MLAMESFLSFCLLKVSSLGTVPPTFSYLVAALVDSCRRMTEDFKGNADVLLTISFDVHLSTPCCHFTAVAWQWRLCLTGMYCWKKETGIFNVNNLVLLCIFLVIQCMLELGLSVSACRQPSSLFQESSKGFVDNWRCSQKGASFKALGVRRL